MHLSLKSLVKTECSNTGRLGSNKGTLCLPAGHLPLLLDQPDLVHPEEGLHPRHPQGDFGDDGDYGDDGDDDADYGDEDIILIFLRPWLTPAVDYSDFWTSRTAVG